MKYNLFIDDERDPPPDLYLNSYIIVAKSSKHAIWEIVANGMPQFITTNV